jgi:hypothetical protein
MRRKSQILLGLIVLQLLAAGLVVLALYVWRNQTLAWTFTGVFGLAMIVRYVIRFLVPDSRPDAGPDRSQPDSKDR